MLSAIKSYYLKHDKISVHQGDIIKNFSYVYINDKQELVKISFPHIIILSQECDLQQYFANRTKEVNNQFLPNILFTPAFEVQNIKEGTHLKEIYQIEQKLDKSKVWLSTDKLKRIKKNEDPRYHFLKSDINLNVPELIIDFKMYYTVSYNYLYNSYKNEYFITINELFREDLSVRFTNYLARIGKPEFNIVN